MEYKFKASDNEKKRVKSKDSEHWDIVFQNCSDDPKTGLTQPSAGFYT